mgnify:CR=1 FL=1
MSCLKKSSVVCCLLLLGLSMQNSSSLAQSSGASLHSANPQNLLNEALQTQRAGWKEEAKQNQTP